MDTEEVYSLLLTSDNLELPQFQKSSSERLVETFIRTQKSLATFYAAEGVKYSAKWERDIGGAAPLEESTNAGGGVSLGIGSPLLKSRIERAMEEEEVPEPTRLPPPVLAVPPKPETFKPSKKAGVPLLVSLSHPIPKPKKKHAANKENEVKSESKVEKELQIEHASRLVERRERKRAKRAILKPARAPSPSSSSSSDDLPSPNELIRNVHKKPATTKRTPTDSDVVDVRKSSKISSKNIKKGKKIIPGTALMQSFSANNVGRDRITLKPVPRIGVFNKGVASAITKVDKVHAKAKSTKGQSAIISKNSHVVFSETAFLNKTLPLQPSASISSKSCEEPKDSASESAGEDEDEDRDVHIKLSQSKVSRFFPIQPLLKTASKAPSSNKKFQVARDVHEGTSASNLKIDAQEDEGVQDQDDQPAKQAGKARQSSPPWVFESASDDAAKSVAINGGEEKEVEEDAEMEDRSRILEIVSDSKPHAEKRLSPITSITSQREMPQVDIPKSTIAPPNLPSISPTPLLAISDPPQEPHSNGNKLFSLRSLGANHSCVSIGMGRPNIFQQDPANIDLHASFDPVITADPEEQSDQNTGWVDVSNNYSDDILQPWDMQVSADEHEHEPNPFTDCHLTSFIFPPAPNNPSFSQHSAEEDNDVFYYDSEASFQERQLGQSYLARDSVEFERDSDTGELLLDDGYIDEHYGFCLDDNALQAEVGADAMHQRTYLLQDELDFDEGGDQHDGSYFSCDPANENVSDLLSPFDVTMSERTFSDDERYLRFAGVNDSLTLAPFTEGKALLLGLQPIRPGAQASARRRDDNIDRNLAEDEVAKELEKKGHWTSFRP